MIFTITAGHGGSDPGNTWNGHHEAVLMTELRSIVALKLRALGHIVHEDGGKGVNWSLKEAAKLIDDADLALEFHTNASNPKVSGVELVSIPAHRDLCQKLAKRIGGTLMIPTRRDLGWLSHEKLSGERGFQPAFTRRGGIIVEVFFQSNPNDLRAYLEKYWLVASGVAAVLHEYSYS